MRLCLTILKRVDKIRVCNRYILQKGMFCFGWRV